MSKNNPKTTKVENPPESFKDPVTILRTCNHDLTSYGGFQWPESGYVEAPDFKADAECGHGLHGLVEGEGEWDLMNWDIGAKALIVETDRSQIIELSGKVKFQSCIIKKITNLAAAICEVFCSTARIQKQVERMQKDANLGDSSKLAASGYYSKLAASGDSSKLAASGDSSKLAASGYYSQLAASGDSSKLAASGYYSQLAASGDSSQLAASGDSSKLAASGDSSKLAASGDSSKLAASGYYSKLAASGDSSVVMAAGLESVAMTGKDGAIALTWKQGDRYRISVGYVGEDLEADTYYRLNEKGEFIKA